MNIVTKAPAKINLFLEILNKRPDGYHNLISVMHAVSLFDYIEVTDINEDIINLQCINSDLPQNENNIVYKAASLIKKTFNINKGVCIKLTKNIPTGAGLGGGSSDAASTIKCLVKLWDICTDNKTLTNIASSLGADVAFFLNSGTALAEGVGDVITPIKNKNIYHFILINPRFGVATPSVYKKIKFPLTKVIETNKISLLSESGFTSSNLDSKLLFNRLEEFVLPDYPEILKIKNILSGLGVANLMSGSGASVFGLLQDLKHFDTINNTLKQYPWDIWHVHSVD